MALTTCADCGREISSLASACVHCGRPTHVAAASAAVVPAPYAAAAECPLCEAPVTHPNARMGGKVWCERCGGQLIYGTDGALVRALPRAEGQVPHARPATPVVIVNDRKSVGLAMLLAFFFGPLGMAYSTLSGAAIMFLATMFGMAFTFGLAFFVTWPVCVIWAGHAASEHNRRLTYGVQVAG